MSTLPCPGVWAIATPFWVVVQLAQEEAAQAERAVVHKHQTEVTRMQVGCLSAFAIVSTSLNPPMIRLVLFVDTHSISPLLPSFLPSFLLLPIIFYRIENQF